MKNGFCKLINSSTTWNGIRNSRCHTFKNCETTDRFTARTVPKAQRSGYNSETYQRRGVSVRQFARRLEILRNDAKIIMLKQYGEIHTEILLMEFDGKIIGTFVIFLNDIVIKACLLSCPAENLRS